MMNFCGAYSPCTWAMWCSDSFIDELERTKFVWRSNCADFRERSSLACRRPRATGECAIERVHLQYLPLCTMSSQLCSRWHGGDWHKCPKLSLQPNIFYEMQKSVWRKQNVKKRRGKETAQPALLTTRPPKQVGMNKRESVLWIAHFAVCDRSFYCASHPRISKINIKSKWKPPEKWST